MMAGDIEIPPGDQRNELWTTQSLQVRGERLELTVAVREDRPARRERLVQEHFALGKDGDDVLILAHQLGLSLEEWRG
jgi:hypothetical protein